MEPVTLLLVVGVGVGGWALRRSHVRDVQRRLASGAEYDEDADVAIHVATHEARSRRHRWLSSSHLLYGMLQDEAVVAAIRGSGGDPEALEDRVLAALDRHPSTFEAGQEAGMMLAYARMSATQSGRRPGCTELWAALGWGAPAVALCEASGIDRVAVLFRLFHGDEPSIGERLGGELNVVLRNDHWTTKEFVSDLLQQVFSFEPAEAVARMEAVHQQGHAVVGRCRAVDARAKVAEARRRAKDAGFPLWVGVEPA